MEASLHIALADCDDESVAVAAGLETGPTMKSRGRKLLVKLASDKLFKVKQSKLSTYRRGGILGN